MIDFKDKKILLITQGLKDGGAQKIIKELISEDDKKLNIKYLCIDHIPKNKKKYNNIIFSNNRIRKSFFKSLNVINDFSPDVVMSTLTNIDLFVFVLRIFSKKKFKHLIRLSVVMSSHYSQYYYFPIIKIVIKIIYSKVDRFICMSDDMIIDLEKNFGIRRERIEKIPNFVSIKNLDKKVNETKKTKTNFICVGRIHHQKGYDILIESLKYTNQNFKISIFGWGDNKLLKKYIELINKNNLQDCINFRGRKNAYPNLMRNYDALILPSRYEGFPNVAIEAMSLGIPVLALPFKGGINEIIKTGLNGEIAKGFRPEDLAETISNFHKHMYKSSTIKSSINQFEKKTVLNKYFQLLKDV